jgi:hypothetical protein
VAAVIEHYTTEHGMEYHRVDATHYAVALPGQKRLMTTCELTIGPRALELAAFVVRHPDDNAEAVYRFLLQRNTRTYGVHWAIDADGDVYLTGRVPLAAVDAEEIDRLFGAVLEYADGAFNVLLELGFAESIRREWAWRLARGEPTGNLSAFEHLRPIGS